MGLFDRRWQAESSAVILVQGSSRSFAYPSSQHARCRHAKRLPSLSSLTSPALLPHRSVHLLCLALASLLAAIPSSALSSNPDARAELHGVLLGASDRLKLGLVSETQVSSGNRGEERSSDYSGGGEWREWVVRALLAVMAWISWSEVSRKRTGSCETWRSSKL